MNMRKIYTLVALVLTMVYSVNAQKPIELPKKEGKPSEEILSLPTKGFSPNAAFLLMDLEKLALVNKRIQKTDSALINKYNLFSKGAELYVNAFLLVSDEFDSTEFIQKGGLLNTRVKNIITAAIPVHSLKEVVNIKGITYIQTSEKVELAMDKARADTWTNWVHEGRDLPKSYMGAGVVIGIIDIGFDYTHPNFYDGTGSNNYRVKRVWEQRATSGTPPNPFSYGRELTSQSAILNAQRDFADQSHGTHVAGIAAGSGGGASTYMGVAPQSDLVFVSYKGIPEIIDGINYIINYANSVNKPCVINMSLGTHLGPHDGTSLFDISCESLIGQGKILVGAAGNDGQDSLYLTKSFTSSDTLLWSFLKFNNADLINQNNGSGTIDIWGNPNQTFKVAVTIFNTVTNQFEDWTPYIIPNSNTTNNFILYDKDISSPKDELNVRIVTEINTLNNKPRILIDIDNSTQDDEFKWVFIEIIGYNTQIKAWGGPANIKTTFSKLNYMYPVQGGATTSTIREIGGTGKAIISVGAYTSKNSWTAFNGNSQSAPQFSSIGAIAPFSSIGPTADGRTKPDITAPGNILASSVSRFDNNFTSSSVRTVSGVTNGTNTWYFGMLEGTSMASPMVAGIIALWLQAYPDLTPAQALNLMKQNAWRDQFTGTIPLSGNNTWGWGKIDAHEGLKDLLSKIPAQPIINPTGNVSFCQGQSAQLSAPAGFSSYQWSNNATSQNITVTTAGNYSVRVQNSLGYYSPWSLPKLVTVNQRPPVPTVSINGTTLTSSSLSGNQWYFNGNIINGANQQNYTATQNGNYYVIVTNANSCTSQSNTVIVSNIPCLTPSISPSGNVLSCSTNPVALTSSANSGNQWYLNNVPIGNANSKTFTPITSGNYTVVFSGNNCTPSQSLPVNVTFQTVSYNPFQDTLRACGDSVLLNAGTGYSNYAWSNGANSQSINVKSSGLYKVTVSNTGGCSGTDSVWVILNKVNIVQNDTVLCPGSSVTLNIDQVLPIGKSCNKNNLPFSLQNGLLAYYPFCNNANDASGNGNNGLVFGATLVADRFGNPNSAYYFNGTDNRIDIPYSANLSTSSFTVASWIKSDGTKATQQFIYGQATGKPFLIINRDNPTLPRSAGVGWRSTNANPGVNSNSLVDDSKWHFIVGTYSQGVFKIYVDGVLENTATTTLTEFPCNVNFNIGGIFTPAACGVVALSFQYFKGTIDDVLHYNRELPVSEIQKLYTQQNVTYTWSTNETSQSIAVSPTINTKYYLSANFGNSICVDSVTVGVLAKPIINFMHPNLISNYSLGNQWYLNGNIIPGATGQTFTPVQAGNYSVRVSISNCTSPFSDTYAYNITSISNLTDDEFLDLYPNPTTSLVFVNYRLLGETQGVRINIMNSIGQIVSSQNLYQNGFVSLSGLANGIYFIQIEAKKSKRIFVKKITKID